MINIAATTCIFLVLWGQVAFLVHPDELYPRASSFTGMAGLAVVAGVVGAWPWVAALVPFALFVLSTIFYEFTDWPTPVELWRSWRHEEAEES